VFLILSIINLFSPLMLSFFVVEAIDMSKEDMAEMQDQDKFCASLKHLLNKLPV
jgi:hypothetical protein